MTIGLAISVRKEEAYVVNNKLAQSLQSNNHRDYWAEIKKFKRHNKNIPTVIDDAHNQADIVDVFASSYKTLFSAMPSSTKNLDKLPVILMINYVMLQLMICLW
jgi:hypothetical protein